MNRTAYAVMPYAVPALLLGAAGCVGNYFRVSLPGSADYLAGSLCVLFALLLLVWRLSSLERDMDELRCMEAKLGFLRETLEKEERTRISRELHDGLGQSLVTLKLNLQLLLTAATGGENLRPEQIREVVDDVARLTVEVRDLVHSFRPTFLDSMSFVEAALWFSDRVKGSSTLTVELAADCEDSVLDGRVKYPLFRIFQEAVINAARHAQAQGVAVRIASSRDMIRLEVCDDGVGGVVWPPVAARAKGGHGLSIMSERVALLGGNLQVLSPPGEGTTLRVEVPLA